MVLIGLLVVLRYCRAGSSEAGGGSETTGCGRAPEMIWDGGGSLTWVGEPATGVFEVVLGCRLSRGMLVRRLNFSIHPSENDGASILAYSGSCFQSSCAAVLSISFVKYSPAAPVPVTSVAAAAILASTHSCSLLSSSGYFGRRARIVLLLTWVLSEALRIVEIVLGRSGRPYLSSNQVRSCLAEHW